MDDRCEPAMALRVIAGIAALIGLVVMTSSAAVKAKDLLPLVVYAEPGVDNDSLWMADVKGYLKAEGLDVQMRLFPSGTTAMQTYRTGAGDILFGGDLPALQYWQRGNPYWVIAPIERDAKDYIVVADKAIKSAKDLIGKTAATRVGSTGSYFVAEYLTKNDVDPSKVTIRNLDPDLMPPALCRGDIQAFFIWQPFPQKALEICGDKVHVLSTAEGYIKGYALAGARPDWLATPMGREKTIRFLRALRTGAEAAANDFPTLAGYMKQKFGMTEAEVRDQDSLIERVLKFDSVFFDDFCAENRWQERTGQQKGPSDLSKWVWEDGLKAIDTSLVVPAPPPC